MPLFGIGDAAIVVIGVVLVFFFGRNKIMEWFHTFNDVKLEHAKANAHLEKEVAAIKGGAKA